MDRLYYLARAIQRRITIPIPDWVRTSFRKAVYEVLRVTGWSIGVPLPGGITVRIPAYFYRNTWNTYEVRSMERYVDWCRSSRDQRSVVLDIGCSVGVYTGAALFANESIEVIGFDADLTSLRLVPNFVKHAPRATARVRLVLGYLDASSSRTNLLDDAVANTVHRIAAAKNTARYEETSYRYLTDESTGSIPTNSLDELLEQGRKLEGMRVLLKCDVEGAEVRVLRGADSLLRIVRPAILLSVHSNEELARHGSTEKELEELLQRHGYSVEVLERDHESHWWCTPKV